MSADGKKINGSFEQGPAVGTFLNLEARNTSLPGWIVTGEGVDLVSTGYWISSDGTRAIDLDGNARSRQTPPYVHGGIAQTFATKLGMRYRVTFDLAGNPNQLPEIPASRITTKGFGSTAPVATTETADGRQRNRRVEVRVQK